MCRNRDTGRIPTGRSVFQILGMYWDHEPGCLECGSWRKLDLGFGASRFAGGVEDLGGHEIDL